MPYSKSRKSWDTVHYSSEPPEMSSQPDMMLEVAFERVENALKNQLNHLRSLGDAVNDLDREDMSAGTFLARSPLLESKTASLLKRDKLWKEGRRDLYRFIKEFEEMISALECHHRYTAEPRFQYAQSPKIDSFPPKGDRASMIATVNFEQPRQVPMPSSRNGTSQRSSPPTLSRALQMLPPEPPVPARHPSRRFLEIHSPTGSVMLFNAPPGFIANRLPEEHVQIAKAKKGRPLRREQTSDPDLALHTGQREPLESGQTPTDSSPTTSLSKLTHPSRPSSSLRLSAAEAETPQPPPLNTNTPLHPSRTQRLPQSTTQHAHPPRTSPAPHPLSTASHLRTTAPPPRPLIPRKPPPPSAAAALEHQQIRFAREKLARDREKARLQWADADRMLRGLPRVEALPGGCVRGGREEVGVGVGVGEREARVKVGDGGLGGRLRGLWRVGR